MLVWPEDGSTPETSAVEAAGFEPVDGVGAIAAARATVREQTREQLDAVRVDLDRAQALYLEQDYTQMDQVLADAEQRALSLLALPGTCDTLWELEFRRGLAALGERDAAATQARFRLAASLRPGARPDAAFYGPDVAQAFAAAVEAERAAVGSPVGLAIEPADATRIVDCEPAPRAEIKLSLGLHVVWASAPGRVPHAEIVDVARTSTLQVALATDPRQGVDALAALPAEVSVRMADASARAVLLQVADELNVDAIVALRRDGEDWQAQLHTEDARGKVHREGTQQEAIEAALAELGLDGRVVMVAPVVAPPVHDDGSTTKRPLVRKWWFWTVLGGVAATAVVVGLVVGLGRGSASGPSRQTIIVE